jgi:hypothetical protein
MGSPLGTRANMEMQRFCDGTRSVGVKESFIGGFRLDLAVHSTEAASLL